MFLYRFKQSVSLSDFSVYFHTLRDSSARFYLSGNIAFVYGRFDIKTLGLITSLVYLLTDAQILVALDRPRMTQVFKCILAVKRILAYGSALPEPLVSLSDFLLSCLRVNDRNALSISVQHILFRCLGFCPCLSLLINWPVCDQDMSVWVYPFLVFMNRICCAVAF